MATNHQDADTIQKINRMAKDVATKLATRTGDDMDPEASFYDDGRVNLEYRPSEDSFNPVSRLSVRYSPKNDSITVVEKGAKSQMPVYIFNGAKSEKPHVFLQGPWQQMLESLHSQIPQRAG